MQVMPIMQLKRNMLLKVYTADNTLTNVNFANNHYTNQAKR